MDGIESGKETRGHKFMAPEPFNVKGFDDYVAKLRKAYVVLDANERMVTILEGARALAAKQGLTLIEDEALLAENAGLTEWPVPLMGAVRGELPRRAARSADDRHEGASEMLFAPARKRPRQPIHINRQSGRQGRRQGHHRRQ